ncbi:hypothetical protein [Streptomyces chumphonensis]|uniref:hypothetical protein n=1 Tax=Streptomyces chumphonensis TaxID=1214925 RepID=UPI003D74DA4F
MRRTPQGRFAALSMCAAATLAPAAEAVADGRDVPVPVDVPLESVEETLPLDAPTVFATVPSSPVTPPETPQIMRGERISVPVVPAPSSTPLGCSPRPLSPASTAPRHN